MLKRCFVDAVFVTDLFSSKDISFKRGHNLKHNEAANAYTDSTNRELVNSARKEMRHINRTTTKTPTVTLKTCE